jgi:hypothetical protein
VSIDVGEVQVIGMNTLAEEVIFYIDVFDSGVKEGVLRKSFGRSVIARDYGGGCLMIIDGVEQSP